MGEIIFLVEYSLQGGFTARALGHSIFTSAESEQELQSMVRDAVACHFEEVDAPSIIWLLQAGEKGNVT